MIRRRCRQALLLVLGVLIGSGAQAQDRRDEQFYYPGSFNWSFLKQYPEGGRLFNAFDYGHAVLYERLLTESPERRDAALEREFRFLTTDLLIRPPRFAVAEEAIEPAYARLAWQAKQMFDWAHVLHRQIYDIYADERIAAGDKDALIERVTDYYLSRKDYAFTPVPKSMALMDEQYFSQTFRKDHPRFNGLIWAYHWLQVGLYEPLIQGKTPAEKKAGVKATLARFWSMLEDVPDRFPKVMPMTSAIAPTFSARHPRAAVIFDNLHTMHDIISDILAADTVPAGRKREVIYQQLAEFRDPTRNVISMEEWRTMAEMMGGIEAMGGPATGLLAPVPVSRPGAAMDHAAMGHGASRPDSSPKDPAAPGGGSDSLDASRRLHDLLMADPVTRERMARDTALQRLIAPAGTTPPAASAARAQDVAAVVVAFHDALARGDSLGALRLMADDVVVLESGGLESRAEFRTHHLPADIAFARAVAIERGTPAVTILGDVAWVVTATRASGSYRTRPVNSAGVELAVLSRDAGGWRIRAVHWSSRPVRAP